MSLTATASDIEKVADWLTTLSGNVQVIIQYEDGIKPNLPFIDITELSVVPLSTSYVDQAIDTNNKSNVVGFSKVIYRVRFFADNALELIDQIRLNAKHYKAIDILSVNNLVFIDSLIYTNTTHLLEVRYEPRAMADMIFRKTSEAKSIFTTDWYDKARVTGKEKVANKIIDTGKITQ